MDSLSKLDKKTRSKYIQHTQQTFQRKLLIENQDDLIELKVTDKPYQKITIKNIYFTPETMELFNEKLCEKRYEGDLKHFEMENCVLNEEVKFTINFENVEVIIIKKCELTGEVMLKIFDNFECSLSHLTVLDLSNNKLGSELKYIKSLTGKLSSDIPSRLFWLDLSNNGFKEDFSSTIYLGLIENYFI